MKVLSPFLLALLLGWCSSAQAQKKRTSPAPPALEQGESDAGGRRVGKWKFYNRRQELELTFDYDSSRIGFLPDDTTRYLVRVGGEWVPKRLGRAPHVLGSTDYRLSSLQGKLRYPVSALRQQLEGTVVLGYTVGANGHTSEYTVESSMGTDCDQEVWRALNELPDNWIPAIYLGRPTATRFYLAVRFRMLDEAELQQEEKKAAHRAAEVAAGAGPPPTPRYVHEIVVTALAIERGGRRVEAGP